MRPCDCKDLRDTQLLNESGIGFNDESLTVTPAYVTLKIGPVSLKISMHRFKQFAEWYLADQEKSEEVPTTLPHMDKAQYPDAREWTDEEKIARGFDPKDQCGILGEFSLEKPKKGQE